MQRGGTNDESTTLLSSLPPPLEHLSSKMVAARGTQSGIRISHIFKEVTAVVVAVAVVAFFFISALVVFPLPLQQRQQLF